VLVCAFAEVPGPTAVGARAEQLLLAMSGSLDVDALSIKGNKLTHIQRVGAARMMRVPVAAAIVGDNTAARGAFVERLGAYKRAVLRQLDNDPYEVVICLDLFSAAAVLPSLGSARLVVEVADIPSQSFAKRYPVNALDLDTKKEWELGERAALKAASVILTPSRQSARLLADRVDPRLVRAVPRLVDTRIFQPPTVEVALDDARTVAFVGGREGGHRAAMVLSAMKSLAARLPDARALWIGAPGRASRAADEALQLRGLAGGAVLVDVNSPWELQQTICAADVVVVAGDADAQGVPHRALEAMACGRAVVVAANEAACRDHITPDQHAVIVGADHADGVIDAVGALLDDNSLRSRLGAAASKQAARFDLGARGDELALLLTETTGTRFTCDLPPLEEITAAAPVARAIPVTAQASPKRTSITSSQRPVVVAPAAALDDGDLDPGEVTDDALQRPTRTTRSSVPLSAARGLASAESDGGDIWAGDTTFDPKALIAPSSPAPDRIKGAMLNTQSGAVARPSFVTAPTPASTTSPAKTTIDLRRPGTTGPSPVRSLVVDDGLDADDDWSLDTIADASPVVEPTRVPSQERPAPTSAPRSFLVEQNIGDMTAEDLKRPGASSSASSSSSSSSSSSALPKPSKP